MREKWSQRQVRVLAQTLLVDSARPMVELRALATRHALDVTRVISPWTNVGMRSEIRYFSCSNRSRLER